MLVDIGYGQIGDFLCEKYILSGKLVSVLPEQSSTPWGVYVYRPQRGPIAERFRIVFDYLVKLLGETKLYKPHHIKTKAY